MEETRHGCTYYFWCTRARRGYFGRHSTHGGNRQRGHLSASGHHGQMARCAHSTGASAEMS
ncbi:hypothetical protein C8Q80DRAFT_179272 [Daedaleopsis nitida]|nr:hypothetical protein C8Q80DRAFT_179272 [Daedaleopsis nitida]